MTTEVWVLGGTGRSGRAVAAELIARGHSPVLVGRDGERLAVTAADVGGGTAIRVVASMKAAADAIRIEQPAVVVNTVGPFTGTAQLLVPACLPTTHYIDLANDLPAVLALLDRAAAARAAGRTLVTGAGFGVTATESVVAHLCAGRPVPSSVRVDMIPSLDGTGGVVGQALAATILEGLPGVPGGGRFSGRRYRNGNLVRAAIGGDRMHLALPDGSVVTTALMPLGELAAAQRASRAPSVVSASSEAPSSALPRAALVVAGPLLMIGPLRRAAIRALARLALPAGPRPREHSWGHARIGWPDGTIAEGWLRAPEAQRFTGAVPAEIAHRLLTGDVPSGAGTPAALFGPSLVESCGATYVDG